MNLARTFTALVMALLVLMPLCGCGKVLYLSGLSDTSPGCPCENSKGSEDEECGGCEDCECNQACSVSKTFYLGHSKSDFEPDADQKATRADSPFGLDILVHSLQLRRPVFSDPPLGYCTPLWKLSCNYRL